MGGSLPAVQGLAGLVVVAPRNTMRLACQSMSPKRRELAGAEPDGIG
jgi:hypothetical protein